MIKMREVPAAIRRALSDGTKPSGGYWAISSATQTDQSGEDGVPYLHTAVGSFKIPSRRPGPPLSRREAVEKMKIHPLSDVKNLHTRLLLSAMVEAGFYITSWPDGSVGAIRHLPDRTPEEKYDAYLIARERLEVIFAQACLEKAA